MTIFWESFWVRASQSRVSQGAIGPALTLLSRPTCVCCLWGWSCHAQQACLSPSLGPSSASTWTSSRHRRARGTRPLWAWGARRPASGWQPCGLLDDLWRTRLGSPSAGSPTFPELVQGSAPRWFLCRSTGRPSLVWSVQACEPCPWPANNKEKSLWKSTKLRKNSRPWLFPPK